MKIRFGRVTKSRLERSLWISAQLIGLMLEG